MLAYLGILIILQAFWTTIKSKISPAELCLPDYTTVYRGFRHLNQQQGKWQRNERLSTPPTNSFNGLYPVPWLSGTQGLF